MRIYKEDIQPLINTLLLNKIRAILVGSLGWRGWSDHDADILIYFPTRVKSRRMQKWDGYGEYVKVMKESGFKQDNHLGMHMEVWYKDTPKGILKVDVIGEAHFPENFKKEAA